MALVQTRVPHPQPTLLHRAPNNHASRTSMRLPQSVHTPAGPSAARLSSRPRLASLAAGTRGQQRKGGVERREAYTTVRVSADGSFDDGDQVPPPAKTRVIVVTSGKGGVGKTTTTSNIGVSIARLGYRVGLLDADIGLRNLDLLLGLENRVLYTGMEVLDGECRIEQALIRDKRWRNLALLCISKNRQRYNVTRDNMQKLTNMMVDMGFHYILIDCPAGIDIGFVNAIAAAQEAVVVTTPEITSIRDADRVAGLLEANGIYDVKLVVNRVRPEMIAANDMMSVKDVQEMLGIPLLGAIPEDTDVIISTNRGEPLVLRKKLTLSGIAFENAARRLVGKKDYLIDLTTPYKSVVQRLKEFVVGE